MPLFGLLGAPDVEKLKAKRDIKGLLKALDYEKSASLRRAAADALGELQDTQAVEPLLAAMDDSEVEVRQAAIKALGRIGDLRAVVPLLGALESKVMPLRSAAADALESIGGDPAVQARCAIVKQDWPRVESFGPQAVEPLIAALRDGEADTRRMAVEILGRVGDRKAVEPLCATLRDSHWAVRQAAVRALAALGDSKAVEPLCVALEDSDSTVRRATVAALVGLGDPRAVEPLCAALRDSDGAVRQAAVAALVGLGDKRTVGPLVSVLKADDPDNRRSAAETLVRIGVPDDPVVQSLIAVAMHHWEEAVALGPVTVVPLIASLQGEDTATRMGACKALIQIGEPAMPSLIEALAHSNPVVRRAAADCIRQIGLPEDPETCALIAVVSEDWSGAVALGQVALAPLVAALRSSDRLETQQKIVVALTQMGAPATEALCLAIDKPGLTPPVVEALDAIGWQPDDSSAAAFYWAHKGEWIKCIALKATALPALVRVLREQDSERVRGAAAALAELGSEDALDALIGALQRSSGDTRAAILTSMKAITGTDLGYDAEPWRRWLKMKRDPLVIQLRSDELPTFKSGRDEALMRAQQGDRDVLELIEDVIRARFGKPHLDFYREGRMPEIAQKYPIYFQFDADRTYAALQNLAARSGSIGLSAKVIRVDPLHAQAILLSLMRKPMYVEGLMLNVLSDCGATAAVDLSLLLLDLEIYSILKQKRLVA